VKKDDYKKISGLSYDGNNLVLSAVPYGQLVVANGDINLDNIVKLDSITVVGSNVKMLVSFDKGVTFHSYYNSIWNVVNVLDISDVTINAMSLTTINGLSSTIIEALRTDSKSLRFAYYLDINNVGDSCYCDSIGIAVDLIGTTQLANGNDWYMSVNGDGKTINYNFKKNGTFTINYVII